MNQMYKINGNPEQFSDLNVFHKLSQQFLPYAQERLGFDKPVGINLLSDPQNAKNPLGKTAYYDPNKMEVTVFVDKRHVKDILRSMSHELVHHTQNCRGEFEGGVNAGEGYAQKDPHMRKMEEEAYLEGQMLLRDFEDNLKKENKVMAEAKEKKGVSWEEAKKKSLATAKAWMKKNDMKWTVKQQKEWKEAQADASLGEGKGKLCEGCGKVHEGQCGMNEMNVDPVRKDPEIDDQGNQRDSGVGTDKKPKITEPTMEEGSKEVKNKWVNPLDKKGTVLCDDGCTEKEAAGRIKKSASRGVKNENWTRGNKDELLFERLVKKWCK